MRREDKDHHTSQTLQGPTLVATVPLSDNLNDKLAANEVINLLPDNMADNMADNMDMHHMDWEDWVEFQDWLEVQLEEQATQRTATIAVLHTMPLDLQTTVIEQLREELPALLDNHGSSEDLQRVFLTWPQDSTLRGMFVAALRNGGQQALRRRLAKGTPEMWLEFAAHHASQEELDAVLGVTLGHWEDWRIAREMLRRHPHLLTGDVLQRAMACQQVELVLHLLDSLHHPGIPGVDLQDLLRTAAGMRGVLTRQLVSRLCYEGAVWNARVLEGICADGNLLWLLNESSITNRIYDFLSINRWATVWRLITESVKRLHEDQLNRVLLLAREWHYLDWAPARVQVLEYIRQSPHAEYLFRKLPLTVWPETELETAWKHLRRRNTAASRNAAMAIYRRARQLGIMDDSRLWTM